MSPRTCARWGSTIIAWGASNVGIISWFVEALSDVMHELLAASSAVALALSFSLNSARGLESVAGSAASVISP
jgi:hypothetical protein